MDQKFARIVFYLQLSGHKQKVESYDIVDKMVVTCSSDTKVLLFDLTKFTNTSQISVKGHTAKVTSCKISPDKKRIVSVDMEGNIIITVIKDET
jgi:WD40 repeat protein